MELMRFLGVAVVGILIDLSIAYFLATMAGLPLWASATLGFLVAALINYAIHEVWTFRQGARALSMTRSIKYLAVSVITLLSRIAVVVLLEKILPTSTLVVLICAAGGSFFVGFSLSKVIVFTNHSEKARSTP